MAALGGGPRLVVGAAVQDPRRGPRGGVDRMVPSSRPSRLLSVRFESGALAQACRPACGASKARRGDDLSGPVAVMSAAGRAGARFPDRSTRWPVGGVSLAGLG